MDIEALKSKLGDETYAQLNTYIDDLTGQRDAARNESISGRKTLKAEVEALKGLKAKLFEKLGIETDEDLETLPAAKGQAEALKQYEAKVKRMEREATDREKAFQDLNTKHRQTIQQTEITKALGKHSFADPEFVSDAIHHRLQWEEDSLLYRTDDGKLLSLDEGVKLLAQTRPTLLKHSGAGGSGYTGSGSRGNGQAKTMSRTEFIAMSPSDRMKAITDGVAITN